MRIISDIIHNDTTNHECSVERYLGILPHTRMGLWDIDDDFLLSRMMGRSI